MRKSSAIVLFLVALAMILVAKPARAQSECADDNAPKGQGKFTGQITGGPTGSLIEVTSGNDSILVMYNNSVLVCQGGRPASANALALHATVVAYGPVKKKGKTLQMTATRILVAEPSRAGMGDDQYNSAGSVRAAQGASQSSSRGGSLVSQDNWQNPSQSNGGGPASGSSTGSGSIGARDNWQNPSGGNSGGQSTGYVQGGGSTGAADSWTSVQQGESKSQSSNEISCNAIQFSVSSTDAATGKATGRISSSGIICKMPVDKQALEFVEFAATGRRLANTTLNWQNQLSVSLMDPEVSSVLFTWDGTSQVVEVTFAYRRAEATYQPSGTHVTF
ncbi:MAG TPA: type VI secretion system tube protein Hcp [Candidatus Acidoferrales bacterium]|nr:type VI secretion system tube protein Hcp [Candidatus Acidoferrales bacterium]